VSGRVTARNYHGQHSRYTVRLHDAEIKVLLKEDGRHGPGLGEEARVRINPAHVLQYGATG
jgi:iron(III) transport system ATP-binding protein